MMLPNLMLQKGSIYVPHDRSKEILLGLRNNLGSMYEKSQIIITHTFALIKCLPGMYYREMLKRKWQLALQASWLCNLG